MHVKKGRPQYRPRKKPAQKPSADPVGPLLALVSEFGPDSDRNIKHIIRQACSLVRADFAVFWELEKGSWCLNCKAGWKIPRVFPARLALRDCSLFATTAKERKAVAVGDLKAAGHGCNASLVCKLGIKSYLGCPVTDCGSLAGILGFFFFQKRKFDSSSLDIVVFAARILALELRIINSCGRRIVIDTCTQLPGDGKIGRCTGNISGEKQGEDQADPRPLPPDDIFENAPVMLWTMDRDWKIARANRYFLDSLGYSGEEIAGRSLMDILWRPESSPARVMEPELKARGRIESSHLRLSKSDGKWLDTMAVMVADNFSAASFGEVFAFALPLADSITAKSLFADPARSLKQARRMQSISTLAGGIAHQFNNALTVILGNLELLEASGIAAEPLQKFTGPIAQAGQRMIRLTNQLLAYARGGRYKTQLVETRQLILDILGLIRHVLGPGIELELDLDRQVAPIEVDIAQIQDMLASIFSNCSEALGHSGQVAVRLADITLKQEDTFGLEGLQPGDYVKLVVEDNGPGMDEDIRARIFEPFYTTKFQGRGLGMAAVYGIVKQHGGWIGIESAPGKGTRVTIYFPMARRGQWQLERKQGPVAGSGANTPDGVVLIVEDEELVMEVNCAIVEKLGYQVVKACSGQEALQRLSEHRGSIAFVLLDVILPDMDGSRLYRLLKQGRPDLKVIVCSGYSMEGPAKQIMEAGAQGFIQKPFSLVQMQQAIEAIKL